MMDEDQEFRFVCKLCFKKYPCGKSLGGHMRSHVVANSAESDEKLDPNFKKFSQFVVVGGGGGGGVQGSSTLINDSRMVELGNGQSSSYGLRENPRKSWRAVDSSSSFLPLSQEKICKQCGKGFQSLKALCGHMACHSDKDRGGLKDDHSWTSENNQKMVMDSHSDTEEGEDRVMRTRSSSKTKRFKKINVVNSPFPNGSSSMSVSEIDGEEQEEVAMCLMMLSRDSGNNNNNNINKGGVNSVVESSDNNSVILETKSSSIDMKNGRRKSTIRDQDKTPHIKKMIGDDVDVVVVKSKDCGSDDAGVENSDSGYFLDECGKAESDVSVDGLRRNGGYNEYDEFRESLIRSKRYRAEVKKELAKENKHDRDYDRDHHAALAARIEQSRKRRYDSEKSDLYNDYERVKPSSGSGEMCLNTSSEKRSKYECFNCKKIFKSYQALGGHRPCHKKSTACYEKYESGDDSTEFFATRGGGGGKLVESSTSNRKMSAKNNSSSDKKMKASKKSKGHICPFCNRVFKNGQALGGHKRSHFIGGHEVHTSNPTPVTKLDLLDLNLPAPHDDEDDGNDQYSPW